MKILCRKLQKQKLKCYLKEFKKYSPLYCSEISIYEARKILKILQHKFKIKPKKITFNKTSKWFGGWTYYDRTIDFYTNHILNIGIISHEYCHLICYKKNIYGHSYKFYNELKKVNRYLENKLSFTVK